MTKQDYNGWTNYETWVVKLWIDNDQGSYNYWREMAEQSWQNAKYPSAQAFRGATQEEAACVYLSEILKREHEETLPELQGFAADLFNAAMSEVNWREIANSLIEDAKEALKV